MCPIDVYRYIQQRDSEYSLPCHVGCHFVGENVKFDLKSENCDIRILGSSFIYVEYSLLFECHFVGRERERTKLTGKKAHKPTVGVRNLI